MSDVVEVSVPVAARPSTIFRFLSEPEAFRRWMGEGAHLEASEGGEVRVTYPGGETAVGEVLELVPDRRLVWTWGFEGGAHDLEPGESTVEVELHEQDDGRTLVTLRHSGIPSAELRKGTEAGWRHYVSVLADQAARDELQERLGPLMESFQAALSEPDDDERMAHLEACFEPDGTFQDQAGVARGREELSAFIGGTHGFQPGIRCELDHDPEQSHEWIRFSWRWKGDDGTVLVSGSSVARVSPEGRLATVIGFLDEDPVGG